MLKHHALFRGIEGIFPYLFSFSFNVIKYSTNKKPGLSFSQWRPHSILSYLLMGKISIKEQVLLPFYRLIIDCVHLNIYIDLHKVLIQNCYSFNRYMEELVHHQ